MERKKITVLPPDSISQSSTPYDHLPKNIIQINHRENRNNYCKFWGEEGANSSGKAFCNNLSSKNFDRVTRTVFTDFDLNDFFQSLFHNMLFDQNDRNVLAKTTVRNKLISLL